MSLQLPTTNPIGRFCKNGKDFFFLTKLPLLNPKIEKLNPIDYRYFVLWELKDKGLPIGYYIEINSEDFLYSHNFIYLGNMNTSTENINHIFHNKYLDIFEDNKLNNILITGLLTK